MRRKMTAGAGMKERVSTNRCWHAVHGRLSGPRQRRGVHGAGRVRLGAQRHLKAHQGAPEVAKRVPVWAPSPAAHISR